MCPNCILNEGGAWVWAGPGLVCALFALVAWYFFKEAKDQGAFEGDEEDPKHVIFED